MRNQNPEVIVLHAQFVGQFPRSKYLEYLGLLPASMAAMVDRFRRWEDRHRALIGRLLVREGFRDLLGQADALQDLKIGEFGRPCIDGDLEFNLSHSGNQVVCAFSRECNLGIDIEQVSSLQWTDLQSTMTPSQWQAILGAANPSAAFFELWTLKESVIKADGRGLSIPLTHLETDAGSMQYGGRTWYVYRIEVMDGFTCHLATSRPDPVVRIFEVNF